MSRKKGQIFSAEDKVKIILELIKEEKTIKQLALENEVTTKSIKNWKIEFLQSALLGFETLKPKKELNAELKKKDKEINQLEKKLQKTTIEKQWLSKKIESSLGVDIRKKLIEDKHEINIKKQSALLNINRTSKYYKPKQMSENNLEIIHAISEMIKQNPKRGYRFIHNKLLEDGFIIGKDRVLKYMNVLEIKI